MKIATLLAGVAAVAGLAVAGAASATPVQSGPCAEFEIVGGDTDMIYNPFSPGALNHPFLLTVTRRDPTATSVRFVLIDHESAVGAPSRLGDAGPYNYDITWLGNASQDVFVTGDQIVNNADGATINFGSGPVGGVRLVPFNLRIPPGQPVASTHEQERLEVSFQCFSGQTPIGGTGLQADSRLRFDMYVLRFFGAYVGTPGQGSGQIDFGPLDLNVASPRRGVAVTAMSTLPYTVQITTDEHGKLTTAHGAAAGIPYTMKYGDLDVADGTSLDCGLPRPPGGSTRNLDVTLDTTHAAALAAGHYTDTISLTFTPKDGGDWRSDRCHVTSNTN